MEFGKNFSKFFNTPLCTDHENFGQSNHYDFRSKSYLKSKFYKRNGNNKHWSPFFVFLNEKRIQKNSDNF